MKNIVALVDFSAATFKVLKVVHQMASAFGSRVVLLHVVPPQPVVMDLGIASPTVLEPATPETVQEEQSKLAELHASLSKFGIATEMRQLTDGSPDAVMEEIRKLGADLVIMGSHRHGVLYELFVGSVTHDVITRMICPVLLVPVDDV